MAYLSPDRLLRYADHFAVRVRRGWPAYTWFPRYTDDILQTTLLTPGQLDPHDPANTTPCERCYDPDLQTPTSDKCPVCFGTGWTGGWGYGRGLHMWAVSGPVSVVQNDTGETVVIPGIWASYDPQFLILPDDILIANKTQARYTVGQMTQEAGLETQALGRMVNLLPMLPAHPWFNLPLQTVQPAP